MECTKPEWGENFAFDGQEAARAYEALMERYVDVADKIEIEFTRDDRDRPTPYLRVCFFGRVPAGHLRILEVVELPIVYRCPEEIR